MFNLCFLRYPDEEAVRNPKSSITEAPVAPYKKIRCVAFINSIPKSTMSRQDSDIDFYLFSILLHEIKEQGVTEDRLVILKGGSGAFKPGVLTALIGVSGAGKMTLMDVLTGRKTGGSIDGNITVLGYLKKQETFARVSGYGEQNDIRSPHVTVYESFLYSAWLRLPKEVDAETRKVVGTTPL
ncbi:hypothetical protein CRYUN_Cryun32bG0028000 [Craigia yunnanensis]